MNRDQAAEMQAVGRGIEADVDGDGGRAGREEPFQFLAIAMSSIRPRHCSSWRMVEDAVMGKRSLNGRNDFSTSFW